MARIRRTGSTGNSLKFHEKLVLNQWVLRVLGVESFEQLAEGLKAADLEGFDEDNISRYYYALRARLSGRKGLSSDVLLGYDQNIVRHWRTITERRNRGGQLLYPKYFQYLSLLFAALLIDHYSALVLA